MKSHRFPQYLSAPYQVLWLEADELFVGFTFYLISLLFGAFFLIGIIIGPWAVGQIKRKYPRGFMKHCLYFIGLVEFKCYPSFFESEFFE